MLPERYEIEIQNEQKMMSDQINSAYQTKMSELQNEASKVENKVVTEKEFKVCQKIKLFRL